MNNLYILHTQYNIILGTAICKSLYAKCNSDLIVFAEFHVNESMRKKLASLYNSVLYITDKFTTETNNQITDEITFYKQYQIFKKSSLASVIYDNIFLSQDRELDSLIAGTVMSRNKNCRVHDIEEDCYFSLNPLLNEARYQKKVPVKAQLKHCFRKLLYGQKYLYKPDSYFYGCSRFFNSYFTLFPTLIRRELVGRDAVEIPVSGIQNAIEYLYNDTEVAIPESNEYYLLFFDLMERYTDPMLIKELFKKLSDKAKSKGCIMLAKYHPRETNKIQDVPDNVIELPYTIPAEKVLSSLYGKKVTVIGNATTAIVVAAKFGFNTISIAKLNNLNNRSLLETYKKMGINVINSISEL